MAVDTARVPVPAEYWRQEGVHGTEIKTSEVRICRRDGVDHPSSHDVGDGSAELVTDLPAGAFAFVLGSVSGRMTEIRDAKLRV
jgi:hypothetical protein